jgi:hypothetical protein
MEYLLNQSEIFALHTKDYNITNTIGLTKFGSFIDKL